jgi:nitrate reductase gamma subunit
MDPVPQLVHIIEAVDGFMEVGVPGLLISGVVLFAAAGYLLHRRVYYNQVRYISLVQDYFPLLLIMAIAITGILMRYFFKVDNIAVKELVMGIISFRPVVPEGISALFYIHLFLVCLLLAYFPFSKLMHAPGIFMSPTRNLANNSRAMRHVNPWNYPVKVHTYAEYEDEFRELMAEAELPLEKPLPEAPPEPEAEGAEAPSEA